MSRVLKLVAEELARANDEVSRAQERVVELRKQWLGAQAWLDGILTERDDLATALSDLRAKANEKAVL